MSDTNGPTNRDESADPEPREPVLDVAAETDATAEQTREGAEEEAAATDQGQRTPPRQSDDGSDGPLAKISRTSPEPEMAAPEEAPDPPDPMAVLQAQAEKTKNQLLRVAADFENYKKRSQRDVKVAAFRARDEVLQDLLPVIDNLELAVAHASGNQENVEAGTLLEGVQMVLRQFTTAMEKFGVKAFDSLRQPFDPVFHEALAQRESTECEPGLVLEEFRRGYLMGDRLIRPAMVVVAVAPAVREETAQDDDAPEASSETAVAGDENEDEGVEIKVNVINDSNDAPGGDPTQQ